MVTAWPSLSFRGSHRYSTSDPGVKVPVTLTIGSETIQSFAKIDTGADYCFFDRGLAEALRIDVEHGILRSFSTVAGPFHAYGHELILNVLGVQVSALVYFFADASKSRNVLGRNGWLNRVRLGLVDYDSALYLSPYDDG
jgi:hypothetical protein